ncbi:hypothetical protein [Fervidobacterium nodosum]|uniref:Adhesin domain-containing protein n=1 Tax=Fervidobacterium nodosum (strain ATCC 35602 / DSM 5306 / Rt17-B1) TaxID=381764 RepID=A7HKH2_FERNB|nr:hypothetical protein [Fervidobacterium nodosum]ABS60405.1 hypothetical protein Fnod_0542 [Fervidobacterium nodosum Rt17-B1]
MREDVKYVLLITLFIVLLGLVGFFVEYGPLKVVIVFFEVVLVGYVFKYYTKKIAGFIVLAIIFFLIPMANFYMFSYLVKTESSFTSTLTEYIQNIFGSSSEGMIYHPDKSLEAKQNVVIDIQGKAEVEFVEGNQIEYPSVLKVDVSENSVKIFGGKKNSRYLIKIGKDNLKVFEASAVGVELSGKVELDDLKVDSVSVKVEGEISANGMEFDGTGVELKGTFKAEKINCNSVGIDFSGIFDVRYIELEGVGINLDMKLSNCKKFTVSGTGVNGKVEYLGKEKMDMELNAVGGTVTLKNLSDVDINIQSSGVKVVRQ